MAETALARSLRSWAAVELFLTSAAHATRMAVFLPLRTECAHELTTANRVGFGIHDRRLADRVNQEETHG